MSELLRSKPCNICLRTLSISSAYIAVDIAMLYLSTSTCPRRKVDNNADWDCY
jgi:hypothetical protein